eukprot:TRINITY_DN1786_c1_g1_i1.p1 TRINITY_DN1786_c1_g1~~TRINITY_DN1786_c1_g1_i1.p1  ORF type:complete len:362 (-),score=83.92 TRINITY_DN1786_c1_g1_i1:46-1131(-)
MSEQFTNLGEHCQFDDCNIYDFLPFKCSDCNKLYCLEHRSKREHNCVGLDQIEEEDEEGEEVKGIKKKKCTFDKCNRKELIPFTCKECKNIFCSYHRYSNSHNCIIEQIKKDKLKLEKKKNDEKKKALKNKQNQLKIINSKKKVDKILKQIHNSMIQYDNNIEYTKQQQKKHQRDLKINLQKLKRHATGTSNILMKNKIYFEIYVPLNLFPTLKKPTILHFFDQTLKVSKILSMILNEHKSILSSYDQSIEIKKLSLVSLSSGHILDENKTLKELLIVNTANQDQDVEENKIRPITYSGDTLLLENKQLLFQVLSTYEENKIRPITYSGDTLLLENKQLLFQVLSTYEENNNEQNNNNNNN